MSLKLLCVLAIFSQLAIAGCGKARQTSTPPRPIVPMPIKTVSSLERDDQCVYYKDFDTNDIYRVSLDGTIRERVVRGGKASVINLAPTRPSSKKQGRIHLMCVPGGSGYTVVEVVAARPSLGDYNILAPSGSAHIANTDTKTTWNIDFVIKGAEIEPGHVHDYWDKVVFTKGTKKAVYDFESSDEQRTGVWLIDESHALLYDYPNVILWNLLTDERTCIAHGFERIVVWPRNLHKKERFTPIAKYERQSWKLSSPDDVKVRRE